MAVQTWKARLENQRKVGRLAFLLCGQQFSPRTAQDIVEYSLGNCFMSLPVNLGLAGEITASSGKGFKNFVEFPTTLCHMTKTFHQHMRARAKFSRSYTAASLKRARFLAGNS